MKKKKKALILAAIAAMAAASALRADEPTGAFPQEKVAEFEAFVLGVAKSPPTRGAPPTIPRIRNCVRELGMPKDVYIAAVERVADRLVADTFVHTNYSGKTEIRLKWYPAPLNLINFMGALGDLEFLPWLEQQATGSDLSRVREHAAVSYVQIAGLDAVPFVRRVLAGSREKSDLHCKRLVSNELFDQIAKAETAKGSQEKIDAAYEMLIEHARHATHVSEVTPIDKRLCQQVPYYQSSIQREEILSRFVNSTNKTVRGNYTRKFNDLQKTPKAERIDLRTRFPGLGEMKTSEEKEIDEPASTDDK